MLIVVLFLGVVRVVFVVAKNLYHFTPLLCIGMKFSAYVVDNNIIVKAHWPYLLLEHHQTSHA